MHYVVFEASAVLLMLDESNRCNICDRKEGVRPLLPDKQPGAKDPPLFRPAAAKQPPLTVPRREEQTSIPPRSPAPCVESARL